MATVVQHAFLGPGHNCWILWTTEGSQQITNPGVSHRALEILVYAIDKLAAEGWQVSTISVEKGEPTLVMLARKVITSE
ncbi:MAG: hypothetical protein ACYDBB_06635 [Armatimonadota bacterium]